MRRTYYTFTESIQSSGAGQKLLDMSPIRAQKRSESDMWILVPRRET
jgi:hypothetical protein